MSSCVRHVSASLSHATMPTMGGDWTVHCWIKCNMNFNPRSDFPQIV